MATHATTRTAIGALLGTVTVAAGSLSNGISAIDTGFGMIRTAADDAARRQQARSKLDAASYKRQILQEKTMELELQRERIEDWIAEKEDRKDRFNSTYAELEAALRGNEA